MARALSRALLETYIAQGVSKIEIARLMGMDRGTVERAIKAYKL